MSFKKITSFVALAILPACSINTFERSSCKTNKECRDEVGFGHVCVSDGFCEKAEINPRCTTTYPENLLSDPELQENRVLIGTLFETNLPSKLAREHAVETALAVTSEQSGAGGTVFGAIFCTVEENFNPDGEGGDGLTRAEATISVGRYLVDVYGVPAVLGPSPSGDTGALFSEFSSNGDDVVIMSPSATAVSLTALEGNASDDKPGLLWRTSPPDLVAPGVIAADLQARGVFNIAIIHSADSYGDGLADGVSAELAALPQEFTIFRYTFTDEISRETTLNTAASEKDNYSEILFFGSGAEDVTAFVALADTAAFSDENLFFGDSGASEVNFTSASDNLLSRVRGVRPEPPSDQNPLYMSYLSSFANRFPQPGEADARKSFAANAFDGAWMVAGGIAWAIFQENEVTGTTIARGMRQMSSRSATVVPLQRSAWSSLTNAFSNGEAINIQGASGSLDFDPITEETDAVIEIWRICKDANNSDELVIESATLGLVCP